MMRVHIDELSRVGHITTTADSNRWFITFEVDEDNKGIHSTVISGRAIHANISITFPNSTHLSIIVAPSPSDYPILQGVHVEAPISVLMVNGFHHPPFNVDEKDAFECVYHKLIYKSGVVKHDKSVYKAIHQFVTSYICEKLRKPLEELMLLFYNYGYRGGQPIC